MSLLDDDTAVNLPRAEFAIEIEPARTQVCLVLHGELDIATVDRVERTASDLYDRGFDALVVDLRRLTFMDSSGLQMLVRLHEAALADRRRFAITEGAGPAYRVLALTGVDNLIPLVAA